MLTWFGRHWGSAIYDDCPQCPTPVGVDCARCGEVIAEGDDGFIAPHMEQDKQGNWVPSLRGYHRACHLRGILGGLNHQMGTCRCCGGDQDPDPEGMTPRQAAEAALEYWMDKNVRRGAH